MSRVLLIRHAESVWNAAGRWQGQGDPPLSARGRLQAEALADDLAALGIEILVTSDLRRAVETGAALERRLGLAAHRCPGLRELDIGRWTGLARPEIARIHAEELAAFDAGLAGARAGGGETRDELAARARASIARMTRTWPASCIAVVTHLGVIRALRGEPLDHAARCWLGPAPPASLEPS